MKFDTKKSDIEKLIQFVRDQGFDETDLMEAANRLERMLKENLIDYSHLRNCNCQRSP